ncbi:response regulator [Methanobacterium sp.]|jgi:CheY-like chemotaxis protein|uniref:response regulator n=1 Tax=Methanobacterium sp. TaxID=2164 RepID=UPI00315886FE
MDVLIIENDPRTISDLKTILRNLGHTVTDIASNGEEAVQKAEILNPDLVLIDIKLKGEMSGVEAANKINDLYKIPVIFLTIFIKNCLIKSFGLPEDAVVLSKPINQGHLEYSISRAVSERK